MSATHDPAGRDLAAAYVLGALEPEEARAFEARLAHSEDLQREVAELREVSALLAHGARAVPRDDDALKRKLLERLRAPDERRATHHPTLYRPLIAWAAAAVLALAAGVQTIRLGETRDAASELRRDTANLSARLAERDATLDQILDASTSLIVLTTTGERPPGIQLFWNRSVGQVVLHAFDLPQAPSGREYQLWFLRDGGVVPGGTFNADPDGHALVTLPGPPADITVLGAAVTEEPAGGSPQPTSAIIVSGATSD